MYIQQICSNQITVNIFDIAMLSNIVYTSYIFFLVYIVDIAVWIGIESTSCFQCITSFLFTSLTQSQSQPPCALCRNQKTEKSVEISVNNNALQQVKKTSVGIRPSGRPYLLTISLYRPEMNKSIETYFNLILINIAREKALSRWYINPSISLNTIAHLKLVADVQCFFVVFGFFCVHVLFINNALTSLFNVSTFMAWERA